MEPSLSLSVKCNFRGLVGGCLDAQHMIKIANSGLRHQMLAQPHSLGPKDTQTWAEE